MRLDHAHAGLGLVVRTGALICAGLLLAVSGCGGDTTRDTPRPPGWTAGGPGTAGAAAQASGVPAPVSGNTNPNPRPGPGPSPMGPGALAMPGMCAEGSAEVRPVTPTVWLIVDGSSSMSMDFTTGVSRWQALRDALMGPTGIVASLQANARFGMVIYSGSNMAECVNLVTVDPALNNHATLDAMYPMTPIGTGTPTDKALDHVFTTLPVANSAQAGGTTDPVYVVLATDGSPNDPCGDGGGFGGGMEVEQRVVESTRKGTQMGANVFIISLAGSDARLQTHLEAVAMVTASALPPFVPATTTDLIAAIQGVVAGGTCQVALNGSVASGQECMGAVLLNGQPLACASDNGWRLTGSSTVQLTGTACDSFLGTPSSQVHASFPCGVFVPD